MGLQPTQSWWSNTGNSQTKRQDSRFVQLSYFITTIIVNALLKHKTKYSMGVDKKQYLLFSGEYGIVYTPTNNRYSFVSTPVLNNDQINTCSSVLSCVLFFSDFISQSEKGMFSKIIFYYSTMRSKFHIQATTFVTYKHNVNLNLK